MSAHFSSCCARPGLGGGPLLAPLWRVRRYRCSAAPGGDSYLEMWKKATKRDRERRVQEFRETPRSGGGEGAETRPALEAKTERFNEILQVPKEERDRVQRLQVIDRAAAAIAAARALISESPPSLSNVVQPQLDAPELPEVFPSQEGSPLGNSFLNKSNIAQNETPGPSFWSWSPPASDSTIEPTEISTGLKSAQKSISKPNPSNLVMEKERPEEFLEIPLESSLIESTPSPPIPPLQSLVEVDQVEMETILDAAVAEADEKFEKTFSRLAAEAAEALGKSNEASSDYGVNPDGSKWWKETGIEQRSDGVLCKWTLTRGVSADETVEWQDKFWEAADQYHYKELGAEKSGRDAFGNVWRENWKESMWQETGSELIHMEKTAEKWGKNWTGDEWQEKWWEHYDASGQAEKWAHKWCCIDPMTPLEAGHAHVWHERWGEKFDGNGSCMKYTDKWAERSEGDGWSKWGDKWDERFDSNAHGVKQGETWWQGQHGDRWNRTWGEQHNGSGWVHKYGKSSSGEHWDTHVPEETWYERQPHFGFDHCLENSVQLRAVHLPVDDSVKA